MSVDPRNLAMANMLANRAPGRPAVPPTGGPTPPQVMPQTGGPTPQTPQPPKPPMTGGPLPPQSALSPSLQAVFPDSTLPASAFLKK